MWYRVFASIDDAPQPADLQSLLRDAGLDLPIHVTGDDLGWTAIDIPWTVPLRVERYLTEADDLRGELDTWAGWVESLPASSVTTSLMQQIVATRQLFTMSCSAAAAATVYDRIAAFMARQARGIYQVDGRGFFAADGGLLLPEP
jgi:hypothetical protein